MSATGKRVQKHTIPSPGSHPRPAQRNATQQRGGIQSEHGFVPIWKLHQIGNTNAWRLCEDHHGYPRGTSFLPDRRLEKERGWSHKAYRHGVRHLLRGIWYWERKQGWEMRHLQQSRTQILRCAELLLGTNRTPQREAEAIAYYQEVTGSLFGSREPHRTRARHNVGRALQPRDRLGRNNVPARTLAAGAGAHRMEQRTQRLTHMQRAAQRYEEAVKQELDRYMVAFLRIHAAVQSVPVDLEAWGFLQNVDVRTLGDEQRMALQEQLMKEVHHALETLPSIPPFGKIIADLKEEARTAGDAARADERKEYLRITAHMRQRIEWITLRHAMEVGVIARLGLLLCDLTCRIQDRSKRDDVPVSEQDISFHRRMSPRAFDQAVEDIKEWIGYAERMSDTAFSAPFRRNVLILCRRALAHASHEEWRRTKECLKEAAALI